MHYTYVLFNGKTLYIGFSKNLKNRFTAHLNKKVHTTKRMGKLSLIFYEAFANEKDARRREKYLKTTKGRKMLRLILKEYFNSGVV